MLRRPERGEHRRPLSGEASAERAVKLVAPRFSPSLPAVTGMAKACVYLCIERLLKAIGEDVLRTRAVTVVRHRVARFGAVQHDLRSLRGRVLNHLERTRVPERVVGELQRLRESLGAEQDAHPFARPSPPRHVVPSPVDIARIASWYPQCFVRELIDATVADVDRYLSDEHHLRAQHPSVQRCDGEEVCEAFRYTARYEEVNLPTLYSADVAAAGSLPELTGFVRSVRLDGRQVRVEGNAADHARYRQIFLPSDALRVAQHVMVGRVIAREGTEPLLVLHRSERSGSGIVNVVDEKSIQDCGGAEAWFAVHHFVRLQSLHSMRVQQAAVRKRIHLLAHRHYSELLGRFGHGQGAFASVFRSCGQEPGPLGLAALIEELVDTELQRPLGEPSFEARVVKRIDRLFEEALAREAARRNPPQVVFCFPQTAEGLVPTSELDAMRAAEEIARRVTPLQREAATWASAVAPEGRVLRRIHVALRRIVCRLFALRGSSLWEPDCRQFLVGLLEGVVSPCLLRMLPGPSGACTAEVAEAFLRSDPPIVGSRCGSLRDCIGLLVDLVPPYLDVLGQHDALALVNAARIAREQLEAVDQALAALGGRGDGAAAPPPRRLDGS